MPVIGSSSYESKPASRNSKEKQYLNQHSTPEERRKKIDVSSSRPTKECPVCCKNHFADCDCDRFAKLTRSEKWKIVNDAKLCKRCLGPHSWYRCKSDKKCTRPNCTTVQANHLQHIVTPTKTRTSRYCLELFPSHYIIKI